MVCRSFLTILFLFNQIAFALEIPISQKNIKLFHDTYGFYVVNGSKAIQIPNYNLDSELRNISEKKLKLLLKHAYFQLKQIDKEEYVLRFHIIGHGGNRAFIAGISFLFGFFMEKEAEFLREFLQDERRAGAEELKRKAEHKKTLKDRIYQMYDKALFNGACVSLIKWIKSISSDDEDEIEKLQLIKEGIENYEQEIRDAVVLQITEHVLKKEAVSLQVPIINTVNSPTSATVIASPSSASESQAYALSYPIYEQLHRKATPIEDDGGCIFQ